jgi:putative nucleotidyltransferase with HDIG domain
VIRLRHALNLPLKLRIVLPFAAFALAVAAASTVLALGSDVHTLLMVLLVLATIPTLVLWLLTARYVTDALAGHKVALARVGEGDLGPQQQVLGRDELAQLAQAFNAMIGQLQVRQQAMADQNQRIEESFLATIEALAAAIEARDPYQRGRTERVTEYALLIASMLEWSPDAQRALRKACILHDIGKIAVPDSILRKQSALDPEEATELRGHVDTGVRMLDSIAFLETALPVIRHHHEHYDGSGYPLGLRGDDIPAGARIIAVADALDAMTSERPYRRPQEFDFAKAEILKGSGKHFDPQVVTAFLKDQTRLREMMTLVHSMQARAQSDKASGWRPRVVKGH